MMGRLLNFRFFELRRGDLTYSGVRGLKDEVSWDFRR